MRPSPLLVGTALLGVLLTGCAGDGSTTDAAADQDTTDAAADGGEDTSGAADAPDDEAAGDEEVAADGDVVGTVVLDGTTHEVTEVVDCTVDDPMAPDDRQFIGRSADGKVEFSVSYFEDEALAGLTGLDLTVEGPDGEQEWASSIVGSDREFTIEQRPDGADGTAELARFGPGDGGTVVAQWSFTC